MPWTLSVRLLPIWSETKLFFLLFFLLHKGKFSFSHGHTHHHEIHAPGTGESSLCQVHVVLRDRRSCRSWPGRKRRWMLPRRSARSSVISSIELWSRRVRPGTMQIGQAVEYRGRTLVCALEPTPKVIGLKRGFSNEIANGKQVEKVRALLVQVYLHVSHQNTKLSVACFHLNYSAAIFTTINSVGAPARGEFCHTLPKLVPALQWVRGHWFMAFVSCFTIQ